MRAGPRVAICGLGLIGGSLARVLTARGYRAIGVDRPVALRSALAARAIVRGASLSEACREAEIVVLAAPPEANLALLTALAPSAPPRLVVTDVTGVKRPIVELARRLGFGGFVGGHPMAGRERSGFASSTPGLFRGRTWILTGGAPWAVAKVRRLVRASGAHPVSMSAQTHDRVAARLSHVPQLVAWALLASARRDPATARRLPLAGPGFRDMTRLARSPRALWRELLRANRDEVAAALRQLRADLSPRSLWR